MTHPTETTGSIVDRRESLLSFVAMAAIVGAPAMAMTKGGLHVDVYNPGGKALFAVSSSIVSGPPEMVLIDAQMRRADARVLVANIRATRERLKAVYVRQSNADFYFPLETIHAAFSEPAELRPSRKGRVVEPIGKDESEETVSTKARHAGRSNSAAGTAARLRSM